MRSFALALAALATWLAAAALPAEARRFTAQESGMNWDSGQFSTRSAPEARAPRATRSVRSARAERTVRATRSARSAQSTRQTSRQTSRRARSVEGTTLASLTGGGGVGPRPRAWCGWWMRTQLGGGPAYNLAWNWRNYGSPTTAHVGAVVVWRHHVGMITGQASNGQWIVKSGNDSNRVRERARSVAGAIFRA